MRAYPRKKTKKGESNPLPPPRCSPSPPRGDACARPEALHVPWHSPLAFRALLVIDRLACVTPSPVPDSETAECRHPPRVWGVALKLGGRRPQRLSKPPKLGLTAWRMGTRVLGPPPRASDLLRSERYTTIHGRRRAPTTCRGTRLSEGQRGRPGVPIVPVMCQLFPGYLPLPSPVPWSPDTSALWSVG
jgi:hypothetical protein